MITIFVNKGGVTRVAKELEPAWLDPASGVKLWVDLADPTPDEASILASYFHFHELSIEDALGEILQPKIEPYEGYVYVVLHGIDFKAAQHRFASHEVDFFLSPQYLVTVHDGFSRSIDRLIEVCPRNDFILSEGTDALLHRILDVMVDNYAPEIDKLDQQINEVEHRVFERPAPDDIKRILELKRDVASLRRVVMPQRDVVSRLARREFAVVNEVTSYRFRDVYDHLVRISEEANVFHDRLMGLLDAHLSFTSNRLNQIMKVLAVISTIFMPLTVITGMWGMNVTLPHFPGPEAAQFWWVLAIMSSIVGGLLWFFSRKGWW